MNEIIATPFVHIIWGLIVILLVTALVNRTYRELLLVSVIVLLIPTPLLTQSLQMNVIASTPPSASLRIEPVPAPPIAIPLPLESVPISKPEVKPKQAFIQTQAIIDYGHNPKPKYPNIARNQGWEGKVIMRVLVSVKGYSEQITIVQSSGHDILDEAAVNAVEGWRFTPAKRGDTAVSSTVNVPINFKLDN